MTDPTSSTRRRWWGPYSIAADSSAYWQIGPLELWVHRTEKEWRIARVCGEDYLDNALTVETPAAHEEREDATTSRYAMRHTEPALSLLPALADRPVVVSPADPLYLPPGEETTLYVSSPLWFQLKVRTPPILLEEGPTFRPSDTWFGPSTLAGELCYATRTSARLQLEDLPLRPHRAVSAVHIRNGASTELLLNKLKLPTPNLSLFSSSSGHLWTEALTLDRGEEGEQAAVRLEKHPPSQVGRTELVTQPRRGVGRGFLIEAFGGFFSRKNKSDD